MYTTNTSNVMKMVLEVAGREVPGAGDIPETLSQHWDEKAEV